MSELRLHTKATTISWCPYCNNIRSMLLGHVYCSRQTKSMDDLSTGTLFIKSKLLEETDDHISRLSIRCILTGEQRYKVGGNEFQINQSNYLVVNQGQQYRTSFQNKTEQEMILVAFKPGFAERLLYSLKAKPEHLLDNPFDQTAGVHFFEKTYPRDPVISSLFFQLRMLIDSDVSLIQLTDTESLYEALLSRLFMVHNQLLPELNKLPFSRRATRLELYKRLTVAKDYLDANLASAITVADVAKVACLSLHHFKRTFHDLFGVSPHQFLVSRRLARAKQLLEDDSLTIREVCAAVGFDNTSSFIRLFKTHTGTTPGKYSP